MLDAGKLLPRGKSAVPYMSIRDGQEYEDAPLAF
ncbi:MAG: hypothetical protein K0S39_3743 [Paenibacillus sp.]|jgi:hypothetical protein|nr:hypothetical protein [Paenibacillus sp.]